MDDQTNGSLRGFSPAGSRDVDHLPIRPRPLHIVAEAATAPGNFGLHSFLAQLFRPRLLQFAARLLQVLHLKTYVMDAAKIRAVRPHVGVFFRLAAPNVKVDVAVRQRNVFRMPSNFLHVKDFSVEVSNFAGILCCYRDMPNFCHYSLLLLKIAYAIRATLVNVLSPALPTADSRLCANRNNLDFYPSGAWHSKMPACFPARHLGDNCPGITNSFTSSAMSVSCSRR